MLVSSLLRPGKGGQFSNSVGNRKTEIPLLKSFLGETIVGKFISIYVRYVQNDGLDGPT